MPFEFQQKSKDTVKIWKILLRAITSADTTIASFTTVWKIRNGIWTDIPEFLGFGRDCWKLHSRRWTLDSGPWTVDTRLWTMDAGLRTLEFGLWTVKFQIKTGEGFGKDGDFNSLFLSSLLMKNFGLCRISG